MSNYVNPVSGNSGFSKINSQGNYNSVITSEAKFNNAIIDSITANRINKGIVGGYVLYEVTGYAHSNWGTSLAGSVSFLNNKPNSPEATSEDSPQLLLLPEGANIVSAVASDNKVAIVGGATLDIGSEVWNETPTAASADIFSGLNTSDLNLPVYVGSNEGVTSLNTASADRDLGSSGIVLSAAGGAPLASNSGVAVEVIGSDNTAGDLAITIVYAL